MVAERAGYTVTMFLIDVSSSMSKIRSLELPDGPNGEKRYLEMSNLEWSLQYVLLKIQEMIHNGRKTDQCGVILFGTDETDNIINEASGGYDHVTEFIPIGHPNAGTLAKMQQLQPSEEVTGDPIDAIIVGIETQDRYLGKKKTWTRKLVVVTDAESPIVLEDWELTADKMKSLSIITNIIGIDFDDEEYGYQEEDKSDHKATNEQFYRDFVERLGPLGAVGTCAFALEECMRPDVKITKSVLAQTVLRLGDVDVRPNESIEISIKTSKCTALQRPKTMKKFAKRVDDSKDGDGDVTMDEDEDKKDVYTQLVMTSEYYMKKNKGENGEEEKEEKEKEEEEDDKEEDKDSMEKVDKEDLVRGYKFGSTYVPCPDDFAHLNTKRGMDICGFFPISKIRRDFSMGEVQYVWADPNSGEQQVALSSLVQAMQSREVAAIARWALRDGSDPKMGVLIPRDFEKVDCFLWVQMPFADDVRKYTFPSLDHLVSKKGEEIKDHAFIPTDTQLDAMDKFVDAMDLMQAGDKDEETGDRAPWFDPAQSYNPALHRIKQALFHAAVVTDMRANPLPPPHPEVLKYMEPPRRVVKRAQEATDAARAALKIKQVPKRIVRARKDEHVRADDDEDEPLLLDLPKSKSNLNRNGSQSQSRASGSQQNTVVKSPQKNGASSSKKKAEEDSETEPESDVDMGVVKKPAALKNGAHRVPSPPSATAASATLAAHEDDDEEAEELEPGRIIGLSDPLLDFRKNIKEGDLVSKSVEDFAWAIHEVIFRPFASRRYEEMKDCMRELRSTCLNEDEIDAWNRFLRDLKKACLSKASSKGFWSNLQIMGREISLISEDEATELGGVSDVSEAEAAKFIQA